MTALPPINRIAIIGAGASGLAAARALLAEDCFAAIDIFEQRGALGGVWNYTPQTAPVALPSTDPAAVEAPVDGVYPSALYADLGKRARAAAAAPAR